MTLTITHAIFLDLDEYARECDKQCPFMRMREYLHEIAQIADDVIILDDHAPRAHERAYVPTLH